MELPKLNGDVDLDALDFEVLPWLMNFGEFTSNEETQAPTKEEKPYTCDFCEKQFRQKQCFTNHRRIHKGEKPYVCEFCDKRFTAAPSLYFHRRIHTGEKPHVCEYCNKGFITKSEFRSNN